jgi:hydroxyethylthiazole kinase-like uncharacterized protein yjeF
MQNGEMEIITGTQSKKADRYAIGILKIPSLLLMERASAAAADDIISRSGKKGDVLICCGVGNNGADGVCIGHMLLKAGKNVSLVVCGPPEKETEEFQEQMKRYLSSGGTVKTYDHEKAFQKTDVLVDAVFGIGLHRPVEGSYAELIRAVNETPHRLLLSVDVPSGINSDTGEEMGCAVRADVTVTFGRNKTGLCGKTGKVCAGEVLVRDIGIPEEAYRQALSE